MTNFEKIKEMSVDEIAKSMKENLICGCCPRYDRCKYPELFKLHGINDELTNGVPYSNLLLECVCNSYKPEKKHRYDSKYCLCPDCLHEEEVYLERKKFRKNFSIF